MKNRLKTTMYDIELQKFKNSLVATTLTYKNRSIIQQALENEDYEKGLKMLSKITEQKGDLRYLMEYVKCFINSGKFKFFYKMAMKINSKDFYEKIDYYISDNFNIYDNLDEDDAIRLSLHIFSSHLITLSSNSIFASKPKLIKARAYLMNVKLEKALEILKKSEEDSFYIYIATLYLNRPDIMNKLDLTKLIEKHISSICPRLKKGLHKINIFDQAPSEELFSYVMPFIDKYKKEVRWLFALAVCDKSEFLSNFSALILLNDSFAKDIRTMNLDKDLFSIFDINTHKVIDFINRFTHTKTELILNLNQSLVKEFKGSDNLDKSYFITTILKICEDKSISSVSDFLLCKSNELAIEHINLKNLNFSYKNYVLPAYKTLFEKDELYNRMLFIISIPNLFYFDITEVDQFNKYVVSDEYLIKIFKDADLTFYFMPDFEKRYEQNKAAKIITGVLSIYKGKIAVINRLLETYEDYDPAHRMALVLLIGDNLESFKNEFLQIKDSSKLVKKAISRIYKDNPNFSELQIVLLKSKKLSDRKNAFEILKTAYGTKFNEQITQAKDIETNEKLKLAMEEHLNSGNNFDNNTNLDFDTIIKDLSKSRRKVEFLLTDSLPIVHDINGEEVSKEYLEACIIAYANESSVGVSYIGCELAKKLNQREFGEYAKQIFYTFLGKGADTKRKWVLYFASIHGGSEMVDILKSQITKWAENFRGAIAGEATKALALNPSPTALLIVDGMSRKFKFKQVKNAAVDAMKFAAEQLNITTEELSDRIVPNLGFDESLKLVFDYGNRKFDVYLNMTLELEVFDEKGKKLKTLPNIGKSDDSEIAPISLKKFKDLKKLLKATVATQRDRLDIALSDGRKWTKDAYINLFVKNPIMHQFAIGLVWAIYEGEKVKETFRYMEDGSFNTSDEDEFELNASDIIGLVHPLELDSEMLNSWKEQLSDYEIIQPLVQLERTIYVPSKEALNSKESLEMAGKVLSPSTLANKLLAQGFIRGEIGDAGSYYEFLKINTSLGLCAELSFSGAYVGYYEDQLCTIHQLMFYNIENNNLSKWNRKDEHYLTISKVDPKFYSEALNQIANATTTSVDTNKNWR